MKIQVLFTNSTADPFAKELIKQLDGLPLALATTGTYLRYVTTSLQDYVRYYRTSWLKLQKTSPNLTFYDHALYTTWNMSLEYIQAQNILAVKLLRLWAYFDHQDLWYQLLAAGNHRSPGWFSDLVEDEMNFNAAIQLLCDHALVERLKGSDGYGMHTCVHAWVVHVLNAEKDIEMARLALICVSEAAPLEENPECWKIGQRLLSHARQRSASIVDSTDPDALDNKTTLNAIHNLGYLYNSQSKWNEAEEMYLHALKGCEKMFGAEDIKTLSTVTNLGLVYRNKIDLKKAEEVLLRALTGYEKIMGAEHIKTIGAGNNLGVVYLEQNKLEKAEDMLLRALTGYEKTWGVEASMLPMLDTILNLGILYQKQSNLKKAEEMYLRALAGYEKIWGGEASMPTMLDAINNFGTLYHDYGNWEKAEGMYLRALTGRDKFLGPEHKDSLATRYNLASTYKKWSKFEDAVKQLDLVVPGYTNLLGPEHPETVDALNLLKIVFKLLNAEKERSLLRSKG